MVPRGPRWSPEVPDGPQRSPKFVRNVIRDVYATFGQKCYIVMDFNMNIKINIGNIWGINIEPYDILYKFPINSL